MKAVDKLTRKETVEIQGGWSLDSWLENTSSSYRSFKEFLRSKGVIA